MTKLLLIVALAVSACTLKPVVPELTPSKPLKVDLWAMDDSDDYPALEDRAYSELDVMRYIGSAYLAHDVLLKKYRNLRNVILKLQKDHHDSKIQPLPTR